MNCINLRGIDGCRSGWLAVSLDGFGTIAAHVFSNAEALLRDQLSTFTAIDTSNGKLSGFGFVERFKLVDQRYPGVAERIRRAFTVSEVGDDDILDALAALWTAERLASDRAVRIGSHDAQDECGYPMNIWA